MNYSKEAQAENFTIVDSPWIQNEVMNFDTNMKVIVKNISFTNFTAAPLSSFSPISINGFSFSSYFIENIYANNLILNNLPLITVETRPSYLSFKNCDYKNVVFEEESPLINFKNLNSFLIINHTFDNIQSMNPLKSSSSLIIINSLNTQDLVESNISDFFIRNSTMGFLKVESIQGSPTVQQIISVRNINYIESTFLNYQTIFSTKGFFENSNIRVVFSDLLVRDIIFEREGEIIDIQHQLPSAVEFTQSIFENITGGRVIVKTFTTAQTNYKTRVLFQDCKFDKIYSPLNSFFHSESQPIVEIRNSTFSNFTLTNQRAGIFTIIDKSIVSIYDSVFQKNAALFSTLFRIESESKFI